MTQPIAAHQDAGAGVGLDTVTRGEIGSAVRPDDLPVGARQDAAGEAAAFDSSADDIDHPTLAIRRAPEMTDVGKLGMNAEERLVGYEIHAHSTVAGMERSDIRVLPAFRSRLLRAPRPAAVECVLEERANAGALRRTRVEIRRLRCEFGGAVEIRCRHSDVLERKRRTEFLHLDR